MMPSSRETIRHEAPVARSAATCLASTAVRGRTNRFPRDPASRSAAHTGSCLGARNLTQPLPQHSPLLLGLSTACPGPHRGRRVR
jgi:hypothetical protein